MTVRFVQEACASWLAAAPVISAVILQGMLSGAPVAFEAISRSYTRDFKETLNSTSAPGGIESSRSN